jgi:hypothetical protein
MRQQLRLNVLIPVAVLGLLGAGFGAYAMGSAPGSDPVAAPVTTTAPAAPAAPATPAQPGKPKPGPVTAEAWAAGANELCRKAALEGRVLGEIQTRKMLIQSFNRIDKYFRLFNPGLKALGWPRGKKALVLDLQDRYVRAAIAFRRAHKAFRAKNYLASIDLLESVEEIVGKPAKTFRRLGAATCANDAAKYLASARGTDSLDWMLLRYRTVVVVFYAPGSRVDAGTVREARAAALDAGAGFVAVNVKREAQVAALAIGYEVLNTPSVLVFVRGPKLKAHFTGPIDRTTVAQAVTNAR